MTSKLTHSHHIIPGLHEFGDDFLGDLLDVELDDLPHGPGHNVHHGHDPAADLHDDGNGHSNGSGPNAFPNMAPMPTPTPKTPVDPRVAEIERSINGDPLGALIYSHHLYPELVASHFDVLMVGEQPERRQELERLKTSALERVTSDPDRELVFQKVRQRKAVGTDLDVFMSKYVAVLQSSKKEMESALDGYQKAFEDFETEILDICGLGATLGLDPAGARDPSAPRRGNNRSHVRAAAAAVVDPDAPPVLGTEDPEDMAKKLKRKYADAIRGLQDEFRTKVAKVKLPDAAVAILSNWWDSNYAWPYPDDDTKAELAKSTKLAAGQVNNWLINRRKRTWHKHFPNRDAPACKEEALELLLKSGIVDKHGRRIDNGSE